MLVNVFLSSIAPAAYMYVVWPSGAHEDVQFKGIFLKMHHKIHNNNDIHCIENEAYM